MPLVCRAAAGGSGGRIKYDLHCSVSLCEADCLRRLLERHPVRDDALQRQSRPVPSEQLHRGRVARRRLPADTDDRHVRRADVTVRVDFDRPEIDKGACLHDDPAGANDAQARCERLRNAGAVMHDIGAAPRVLPHARDKLVLAEFIRIERERRPSSPASSSRERKRSMATSFPHPSRRALIRWQRPSGPTPYTTTDSPKATPLTRLAVSAPCVTAITSVSTASSSGSSPGTRKTGVPGSRNMSSAQPPKSEGGRDTSSELP